MKTIAPFEREPSTPTGLRTPPHSLEAEQAVLGGLLLDNRSWDRVAGKLHEDDFYRRDHRAIFRVIRSLIEANQPADAITVAELLASQRELEDAGGLEYIGRLVRDTPTAANAASYAAIVIERAKRRHLIEVAGDLAAQGFEDTSTSVDKLIDAVQAKVMALTERVSGQVRSAADGLPRWLEVLTERFESGGGLLGIETGFAELDACISGLERGSLVVIAGRPSMGKTTIAMNIVEHVAVERQLRALVFELEMTSTQLIDRLVSSLGRVPLDVLRDARLDDHDWPRITRAVERLDKAQIWIDDTSGQSLGEMAAKARLTKRLHGLDLIVVDYLQLMEGEGDTREQEVSRISRGLKTLAKQLDVPIIALSQLNRAVEQRPNKRPVLSDLRESGAIEQDADVVVMMYRDEIYNPDSQHRGIAEAHVVKQRNGPLETIRLAALLRHSRFDNLSREQSSTVVPMTGHPRARATGRIQPDVRELAAGDHTRDEP